MAKPPAHLRSRPEVAPTRSETDAVEANSRLTGATAALLLVLLAGEGCTILSISSLRSPHIFIGMMLIPPVLLKAASTGYRFVAYYRNSPEFRRKGPPPPLLRLLGPFVVLLSFAVLGSGVLLTFGGTGLRSEWLLVHKATFVLWFGAMTIHVLAHLAETARLVPRDLYRQSRREVRGASGRQWLVAASLLAGLLLGVLTIGHAGHFGVAGT